MKVASYKLIVPIRGNMNLDLDLPFCPGNATFSDTEITFWFDRRKNRDADMMFCQSKNIDARVVNDFIEDSI